MCGIFGFSSKINGTDSKLALLRDSLSTLVHRGPDSVGEYYDDKVYLGHRRLSIIDLSNSANQPFKSARSNVFIVFNGEIYNYRELTNDLSVNLITSSDTEVILEGYIKYGVEFFKKLRGIYAFAIYDLRTEPKIVLYRDLAGVKPLYYSNTTEHFAFASEIKALKCLDRGLSVNEAILKSYLALGYCIEPKTIYKEIESVEPGQCLVYSIFEKRIRLSLIRRYNFNSVNDLDFLANKSLTKDFLIQAVNRNLVADVPVSFSLSGGIDSSLIVAHNRIDKIKSICIKFNDPKYDESLIAKTYSEVLDTPLDIVTIDAYSSIELLNKLFLHFDQPYSDSSAIPFYFLSKEARKIGKVLIGGDGGDEIHNGYPSFSWLPFIRSFNQALSFSLGITSTLVKGEKGRKIRRLQDLTKLIKWDDIVCEWSSWIPPSSKFNGCSPFLFDKDQIYDSFSESFNSVDVRSFPISITKNYFFKRMLSDYLRKADMMSMINSLEYRVPLLDEDLVEFSLTIPYHQKSGWLSQKRILRSLHEDIFPASTSQRKKSGFGIPLDKWLSIDDFRYIESVIKRKDSITLQFIRLDYIDFLFKSIFSLADENIISRGAVYQRILLLYSLELWNLN